MAEKADGSVLIKFNAEGFDPDRAGGGAAGHGGQSGG